MFRRKSARKSELDDAVTHALERKVIPYDLLDAAEFEEALRDVVPADDFEFRLNAARNFLHRADISRAAEEFPKARALLAQIAVEHKTDPKEVHAVGVIGNLGLCWPDDSRREYSEDRLERALLIIEHLRVHGFVIEFFIAFCLEKILPKNSARLSAEHAAHYAQRAAKLRPSGNLTSAEWERIRNQFFAGTCVINLSDTNNAFKAHSAMYGDTKVVFNRPK